MYLMGKKQGFLLIRVKTWSTKRFLWTRCQDMGNKMPFNGHVL